MQFVKDLSSNSVIVIAGGLAGAYEYYMNSGIDVYFVNLTGKDPNELGFKSMVSLIKDCKQFTFSDLIKHKLAI